MQGVQTREGARRKADRRGGSVENYKIGPPVKKTVTFDIPPVTREEPESVQVPEGEELQEGNALPYLEVPPIRATIRAPTVDPVQSDQNPKMGPSYQSRAPVEIGLDVEGLVEAVLDMEISVPLRSLAGVSTAIQKEIKKQVTKSRLPVEKPTEKVNLLGSISKPWTRVESLPSSIYMVMTEVSDEIPEEYLVGCDPVLQYLMENKEAVPGDLIVAKRSEGLRSVYMTINRTGQEECVLDNGSMIVSMAKTVAVQLGLTWDPTLQINMESATSHTEMTLGLAKNVCFSVGGLDLLLQVHILDSPPYKVLLG
jgi:hypothetical protein